MKKILMLFSIILLSLVYINENNANASTKNQKVTQHIIIRLDDKLNNLRDYIDNKDLNDETKSHVETSIKDIQKYISQYKNKKRLLNELVQSIDNVKIQNNINGSGRSYIDSIVSNPKKFNNVYLTNYLKKVYINFMRTYNISLKNKARNNKFSYKYWNDGYFNPSLLRNRNFISFEGDQESFTKKTKIPLYKSVKKLRNDKKQNNADANIGYLSNRFKHQIGIINSKTIMVKKYSQNIFIIKYKNKTYYVPKNIISPAGNSTAFERYNTYINNNGDVYSLYNIFNTKNVIVQNGANISKAKYWFSAFQETYPFGTKISENGWKQNISHDI